jgi:hypothetical protein
MGVWLGKGEFLFRAGIFPVSAAPGNSNYATYLRPRAAGVRAPLRLPQYGTRHPAAILL